MFRGGIGTSSQRETKVFGLAVLFLLHVGLQVHAQRITKVLNHTKFRPRPVALTWLGWPQLACSSTKPCLELNWMYTAHGRGRRGPAPCPHRRGRSSRAAPAGGEPWVCSVRTLALGAGLALGGSMVPAPTSQVTPHSTRQPLVPRSDGSRDASWGSCRRAEVSWSCVWGAAPCAAQRPAQGPRPPGRQYGRAFISPARLRRHVRAESCQNRMVCASVKALRIYTAAAPPPRPRACLARFVYAHVYARLHATVGVEHLGEPLPVSWVGKALWQ